ncbi:MAG: DNA repair protein RecN [Bacteroidia bacterium]
MLNALYIQNYALIDELKIEFDKKLTIITGETGAGKSILLGALGLILGKRADTTDIADKSEKCIVEAHFDISNLNLNYLFEDNEIEYSNHCIIRREITKQGKSRAFINDCLVNLNILKSIASFLVDIQSQNSSLLMTQSDSQLNLVDSCISGQIISDYNATYELYKDQEGKLRKLKNEKLKIEKDRDYNEFLYNEIHSLHLTLEDNLIEEEIAKLSESETIQHILYKTNSLIEDNEINIRGTLREISRDLQTISSLSPQFEDLLKRLDSCTLELSDIAAESLQIAENTEDNPKLLTELNERLGEIHRLQRKHQLDSVEDLLNLKNQLDEKLNQTELITEEIEKLEIEVNQSLTRLTKQGEVLSEARILESRKLEAEVLLILKDLSMEHTQIKFSWEKLNEYSENGNDSVDLLFSSNPGVSMKSVSLIASGGELSRLSFALRSIISRKHQLPTLIYDEADTGVSGNVAAKMGKLMREMGDKHQVICITHLPQVASSGEHQFEVIKEIENNSARTKITKLTHEQRITAIAKMLSGTEQLESAYQTAKELLDQY